MLGAIKAACDEMELCGVFRWEAASVLRDVIGLPADVTLPGWNDCGDRLWSEVIEALETAWEKFGKSGTGDATNA